MRILLLILVMLTVAVPAQAQMMCGPRNDVVANLEKGYAERPVSIGLASNGAVIEVFVSTIDKAVGGKSFTILMTRPDGLSCLMAVGNNWETVARQKVIKYIETWYLNHSFLIFNLGII